jgi:hypothetical protein
VEQYRVLYVLASTLTLVLATLRPLHAGAVDAAEAESLIRQGVQLRQSGNDHRALPLFRKAYEIQPIPRTTAQLGLCEMALGYAVEAERHLMETLSAAHDPWVGRNRKTLEDALSQVRAHIGDLIIGGHPAGAEVLINGRLVGPLPINAPIRLGEGSIIVEVRAAAYRPQTRTLRISGGTQAQLVVTLVAANDPAPKELVVKQLAGDDGAVMTRTSPNRMLRLAAWGTAAVAAGGLAFGMIQTSAWRQRTSEFEGHKSPRAGNPAELVEDCGSADPDRGGTQCAAIYDRLQRARRSMIAGYAVGGAAAIGSAALFFLSSPRQADSGEKFACNPAIGINGAVCAFAF